MSDNFSNGRFWPVRFIPFQSTLAIYNLNPSFIPRQGEICMEIGGATTKMKLGDGTTPYIDLPYAFTGGGGGGTPTLSQVTDYTTLGVGANVTPYDIFVGDTTSGTVGSLSSTHIEIIEENQQIIGMLKFSGGPSLKDRFYIFDRDNEKFTYLLSGDLSDATSDIEINLPYESGKLIVADGTSKVKIKDASDVAKYLELTFGSVGLTSNSGLVMASLSSGNGTRGQLLLGNRNYTGFDVILGGNESSSNRQFVTPKNVTSASREIAVRGSGVAPTISTGVGNTGITVGVYPGSDDQKGCIYITTGTSPSISGSVAIAIISYLEPYTAQPSICITSANKNGTSAGIPYVDNSATPLTGFSLFIDQAIYGTWQPSRIYNFWYQVMS